MSRATWQQRLRDAAATEHCGRALAAAIRACHADGLLITLDGELGTGKTTLTRGLLRGLGVEGPVPSPTYTLLEPYAVTALQVNHLDLYRLSSMAELDELGWREMADSVRIVEWPSRVDGLAASADLSVRLGFDGDGRRLQCEAGSDDGRAVLAALAAALRAD